MIQGVETLTLDVRADTHDAARAIEGLKRELQSLAQIGTQNKQSLRTLAGQGAILGEDLAQGMARAATRMEGALERFIRTGKINFQSFRDLALGVLADLARAAFEVNLGGALGNKGAGGVLNTLLQTGLNLAARSFAGRASGGPVTRSQPYVVGELGPELFVPQGAGRIERMPGQTQQSATSQRPITINITLQGNAEPNASQNLQRSAQQIASRVRRALEQVP